MNPERRRFRVRRKKTTWLEILVILILLCIATLGIIRFKVWIYPATVPIKLVQLDEEFTVKRGLFETRVFSVHNDPVGGIGVGMTFKAGDPDAESLAKAMDLKYIAPNLAEVYLKGGLVFTFEVRPDGLFGIDANGKESWEVLRDQ